MLSDKGARKMDVLTLLLLLLIFTPEVAIDIMMKQKIFTRKERAENELTFHC